MTAAWAHCGADVPCPVRTCACRVAVEEEGVVGAETHRNRPRSHGQALAGVPGRSETRETL